MKTVVSANSTKTALPAAVTILPNKTEPPIVTTAETQNQMHFSIPDANTLVAGNKRPATLELNKTAQAKKPRLVTPLLLDSPDLQNMKTLNTPDLEKILLSSNMLQTPQPGTVFPTKVGPNSLLQVTSEQEAFGKGFEEALHSLHTSKNAQANNNQTVNNNMPMPATATAASTTTTAVTGMSGGSFTYTNLDSSFPVSIKDEPQNPSSTPPVSPIDMETQEKIKLERKRQRNRVAASKCRKRKLERISKLEDKVKNLKAENGDLGAVVKSLKDHVAQLKEEVMEHFNTGCNLPTIYSTSILMSGK